MRVKLFWDFELIMQIIFVIQFVNSSVIKRKNILVTSIFLFMFNSILLLNFGNVISVDILLHIVNLFCVFFLYKENSKKAVVSFSFAYTLVLTFNFIQGQNVFIKIVKTVFRGISLADRCNLINMCFFVIFIFFCIMFFTYIKDLLYIINENIVCSLLIIILGFFIDIIMVNEISKSITINMVILINKIMIINMFLLILAIIYTIFKFDNKINTMSELNDAIDIKNGELRKIKHDYGAQISYLYGLFLLKRYEDLGKALNNICMNDKEISSAVSISDNKESIIYKALKPLLDHGIHILLEENIDSSYINISEEDLTYILVVITNNLIKNMDNDGMVIVKVYEVFENAVIDIESSYTNKKIHIGRFKKIYLNIVEGWEDFYNFSSIKKIIEENNGEIHIKNKDISTLIRLSIPTISSEPKDRY